MKSKKIKLVVKGFLTYENIRMTVNYIAFFFGIIVCSAGGKFGLIGSSIIFFSVVNVLDFSERNGTDEEIEIEEAIKQLQELHKTKAI